MPSRKLLKKEINDTLGALIEDVYLKELTRPKLDLKKSEKLIDEAIALFDDLIQQMHTPADGNSKKHFASIRESLKKNSAAISEKIEKL